MKLHQHLLSDKKKSKREKDYDILRKIRLTFPSNISEAQAASLLGPLLGQYGINISLFLKQFNEKVINYDVEVIANIIITLYRNKSFFIEIKGICSSFIIYEHFNNKLLFELLLNKEKKEDISFNSLDFQLSYNYPKNITLADFYKLSQYKNIFNKKKNLFKLCNMLKGTLNSMHIQIII
jgi:ribosomal protein L11